MKSGRIRIWSYSRNPAELAESDIRLSLHILRTLVSIQPSPNIDSTQPHSTHPSQPSNPWMNPTRVHVWTQINAKFSLRTHNQICWEMSRDKNSKFWKFKTTDILKVIFSLHLSQWFSDFDEIWFADANFDFENDHVTKNQNFQIQDGVRTPYLKSFSAISQHHIVQSRRNLKWSRITVRDTYAA